MPTYNVEDYIEKSLGSVIAQKGFKDFEIIIVNDGTKDRSIERIVDLVSMHPNIILIEQKNSGLSEARNAGMRIARGDFISFIDTDDWIEPQMLSDMFEAATRTGSEIAVCNIKKVYEHKSLKKEEIKSGFSDQTVLPAKKVIDDYFEHRKIAGYAWNKIYKQELFRKHHILYPKGKLYEDLPTTFELIWHSKNVVFLEGCYYNYLQRGSSITGALNVRIWDLIENVYSIKKFLIEKGAFTEYRSKFLMLLVNQLFRLQLEIQKNKGNENCQSLRKKLNEEVGKISLMEIAISDEVKVLTKIKFVFMKFKFDRLLDLLLRMKRFGDGWRSAGRQEMLNNTVTDLHKEGGK